MELFYGEPEIDPEVRMLDHGSAENLPEGVVGPYWEFVDLYREGLSGMLLSDDGAWRYKRNLGGTLFGPAELLGAKPVPATWRWARSTS